MAVAVAGTYTGGSRALTGGPLSFLQMDRWPDQQGLGSLSLPLLLPAVVIGIANWPSIRQNPAGATVFIWTLYFFEEGNRGWENWGLGKAERSPPTVP